MESPRRDWQGLCLLLALSIVKFRARFLHGIVSHHPTKCLLKNSVAFGHDKAAARGR